MNPDDMTPEQAVWAYSSMLHDSRQERDSLRRELNIVIRQLEEAQADLKRMTWLATEWKKNSFMAQGLDAEDIQDAE